MPISQQIAQMVDILPDDDQALAFELVKKLVLAWDPDYTKATAAEDAAMNEALKELSSGDYVTHSDIITPAIKYPQTLRLFSRSNKII